MPGDVAELVSQLFRHVLFLPELLPGYPRAIDGLQYFQLVSMVFLTGLAALAVLGLCCRDPRRAPVPTRYVVAPLWFEIAAYGSILAFFVLLWATGYDQFLAGPRASAAGRDAIHSFAVPGPDLRMERDALLRGRSGWHRPARPDRERSP